MREIQSNSQARWYMFVSVSGIVVFIVGCFLGSWKVIGFGLLMIGGWYKGLQGIYAMISFYFMYKKQKAKLSSVSIAGQRFEDDRSPKRSIHAPDPRA